MGFFVQGARPDMEYIFVPDCQYGYFQKVLKIQKQTVTLS